MRQAGYTTYELEDPRDPEYPVWVGYGPRPTPWKTVWDFRQYGTGPLFDWLRDLDALGLRPIVSKKWRLGRVTGIEGAVARLFVRERIMLICRMSFGDLPGAPYYPEHPEFLLNPRLGKLDSRKPIEAMQPDGQTLGFLSVGHAVEHGYTRSGIYRALKAGGTHRGLRWRYAAGQMTGRVSRSVEQVTTEGEATRYASIYAAAKATGLPRPTLVRLIETSEVDSNGCRWREVAE